MFSAKIREIRESKNLNQEAVAAALNVSKNTYLSYEKGSQSPKLETVEKLAKFYGLPITAIISNEETQIDSQLKSKLAMIEKLNDEEKNTLMIIIESLVMRSRNLEIHSKFSV
ncbi:helix-turn-helix transcriptional regulator [Vibrio sp. F13]|nr:helix-turn-helix transcriptional regulator [Vibrio sp. F13]